MISTNNREALKNRGDLTATYWHEFNGHSSILTIMPERGFDDGWYKKKDFAYWLNHKPYGLYIGKRHLLF